MKKIGVKFNKNLIYLVIVILVILMLVLGRKGGEDVKVLEENLGLEESTGSGFLSVETMPSNAEILMDDVFSGISPTTLYNVPAGQHNVVIKKEGYEDFIREVSIEAGKKTVLEVPLVLKTQVKEANVVETVDEETGVIEIVETKETLTETPKDDILNVGVNFLLYYDFSEKEFADKRSFDQDIFSQRYTRHFIFTRINPANIKAIDKGIDDVEKEDCVGIMGQFEWLYSGQSLCVITKENDIVALGGTWDETKNAELVLKVFS